MTARRLPLAIALLVALLAAGSAVAQTATPTVIPIDGATDFAAFKVALCRLDPASLNLGQSEEMICLIPGLQMGDMIDVQIPPSLEAALVHSGHRVISNNQLVIRVSSLVNSTNGAALDWTVVWFNRTQKVATPGPAATPTASVTNTPANTATATATPTP